MKFALIETANIYTDDAAAAAAAVTATIIVFAIFKHVFPLCFGSLVGFFSLSSNEGFCYFIYLRLPFGIFTIAKSLTRQQSNRNPEQNSKN